LMEKRTKEGEIDVDFSDIQEIIDDTD